MCGENRLTLVARGRAFGSSPRVRGKQVRHRPPRRRRLIPACAGKTLRLMHLHSGVPAHPRVCGENHSTPCRRGAARGSSPRVRGKHTEVMAGAYVPGLIPARAGKTSTPARGSPSSRAHPPACGENDGVSERPAMVGGSSPRVRGKPRPASSPQSASRLIPARAGKTTRWRRYRRP